MAAAVRPPPPAGQEISARDGDRIIVDDDARVQIVRQRQATVRAIFNHEQRTLIMLADYAKPGEFRMARWMQRSTSTSSKEPGRCRRDGKRWRRCFSLKAIRSCDAGMRSRLPGPPASSPAVCKRKAGAIAAAVLWYRGATSMQRACRSPKPKTQLAEAAKRQQRWQLFSDGLPELRLRLRSRGRVHVDIALEIQIELLERGDQRPDVIVRRLPCCRQ